MSVKDMADVLKPLTVDKEKDSFETWAKAVDEQRMNRIKLKGEKDVNVYKQ